MRPGQRAQEQGLVKDGQSDKQMGTGYGPGNRTSESVE